MEVARRSFVCLPQSILCIEVEVGSYDAAEHIDGGYRRACDNTAAMLELEQPIDASFHTEEL